MMDFIIFHYREENFLNVCEKCSLNYIYNKRQRETKNHHNFNK